MQMNKEIKLSDIKDKKLMIATPMYGGACLGSYTNSTNMLAMAAGKYGLDVRFYYMYNESLITRARNYCVDEFLRSDCTHLMFIDSDIGFQYTDVLTLLHICDEERSIVTAPYPKKTISWEKVKKASDMGYGKDNPYELENFVGDFVVNLDGEDTFNLGDVIKVKEAGTGFMMIHRSVFSKYADEYPELKYKPDHSRSEHFDGSREITAYFDCIIDPETKRYLSEDYMFCHNARKIGIDVYMCPWIQLKHTGSYTFGGSIGAMAAISAPLTSDNTSNKKVYEKKKASSRQVKRALKRKPKKGDK